MSTPMPNQKPARAFASNRARLKVNNSVIGWANDFSVQESFGNVPIRVFGHAEVQLFETVAYNVSGSFSYMHILESPLYKEAPEAWFDLPWNGSDNTVANQNIIRYLSKHLTLEDWYNDKVVLRIEGFKPEGRVFRLSEGAITMVNCTFVATAIYEEPGAKTPPLPPTST
jgi:hypothetical protein